MSNLGTGIGPEGRRDSTKVEQEPVLAVLLQSNFRKWLETQRVLFALVGRCVKVLDLDNLLVIP